MAATASTTVTPGTARLNQVIAALGEMSPPLQGPMLRQLIEYGLERLQHLEEEHYTFLGECALLAANNMQDIRLQDLEQRVDALEHPPGQSWGDVVTGIALDLALQVVVLAAWEFIAAQVIAVASSRMLGAGLRASWKELSFAGSSAPDLMSTLEAVVAKNNAEEIAWDRLSSILEDVSSGRVPSGGFDVPMSPARSVSSMQEWMDATSALADARAVTRGQAAVLTRALSADAGRLERIAAAFLGTPGTDEAIAKYWANWREFIGGERGDLLLSPMSAVIKQAFTPTGPSRTANEVTTTFLSSGVTGRYLSWASNERRRAAEAYSSMRLYVRYTDDTLVRKGDSQIQFLSRVVTQILPQWEVLHVYCQGARPWIVKGFEAAFWREYLQSNGMLDVDGNDDYTTPDRTYKPGQISEGRIILETMGDDPAVHYKNRNRIPGNMHYLARYYPGASGLTDLQAEYLYTQFAKPFFSQSQNAESLKPFPYDQARYDNVSALHKNGTAFPDDPFWGTPNPERVARMNEMRIIVIAFFAQLTDFGFDERLKGVMGEDGSVTVDEWSRGRPIGTTPSLSDPDADRQKTIESAGEHLEMLLDGTGTSQDESIELAKQQLTNTLFAIQMQLLDYSLLTSGSTEMVGLPKGTTSDDILHGIGTLQSALKKQYDELKELVADDPDQAKAVFDQFESAYQFLFNWNAAMNSTREPTLGESFHFPSDGATPEP